MRSGPRRSGVPKTGGNAFGFPFLIVELVLDEPTQEGGEDCAMSFADAGKLETDDDVGPPRHRGGGAEKADNRLLLLLLLLLLLGDEEATGDDDTGEDEDADLRFF